MEPFFLGYLLIPLGYTSALAALSASAERSLVKGDPEKAIRLLSIARKAPFLSTYRSMCDVNLITAAYAVENYNLVEEIWHDLEPKLEALRPYAGSAIASYGATLIGRGRYQEAEQLEAAIAVQSQLLELYRATDQRDREPPLEIAIAARTDR